MPRLYISPETLAQIERDYPPEQVQEVIDQLIAAVEDQGTFAEQSEDLDLEKLAVEDPETYQALIEQMRLLGYNSIDEWIDAIVTPPTLN